MGRRAYFKGVELVQHFQHWEPFADRGATPSHQGVTQTYEKLVPDSPCFKRGDLSVRCVLGPIDLADVPDGLDAETTVELALLQAEAFLIAQSKGLGTLSRAQEDDNGADVSGSYAAGLNRNVVLANGPASWTPVAGRLLLFRNPDTGAGFVTPIKTTPDATHVVVDLEAAIDTAWEVVEVQIALDGVRYLTMRATPASETKNQRWRPDVTYRFDAGEGSAPRYAAAHVVTLR